MGRFVAPSKKKNNLTSLDRVIHTKSRAKEHAKLKKIETDRFMVTKRTDSHAVNTSEYSVSGLPVFYSGKPFVVLFCAAQFIFYVYRVSCGMQIVKIKLYREQM